MTGSLALFSTLIAAVAAGFSGWQLRLIHQDRKQDTAECATQKRTRSNWNIPCWLAARASTGHADT